MLRGFMELFNLQVSILLPLIVFILLVPDALINGLYGPHWKQSIPVVRALCLVMLGRGLTNIFVPYLMATGAYRYIANIKLWETGIFLIGVVAGARLAGLIGVAVGVGIAYAFAAGLRALYVIKVGEDYSLSFFEKSFQRSECSFYQSL